MVSTGDPDGEQVLGAVDRLLELARFGRVFNRQVGVRVGGVNERVHHVPLVVGEPVGSHAITRIRMYGARRSITLRSAEATRTTSCWKATTPSGPSRFILYNRSAIRVHASTTACGVAGHPHFPVIFTERG